MSRQLALSFVAHNPFAITRYSWLGIFLMVMSLYAILYTGLSYFSQQRVLADLNEELNLVSQAAVQKNANAATQKNISPEVKLSAVQKKQIEETMAELMIDWDVLFQSIEKTAMDDIALLEISPNSKKKQMVLIGEAKNLKTVFAYIKALDDTPILSKVYLQSHSVDDNNISKPVRFTLSAEWILVNEMRGQP